jgi:uncharacterized damage-inducible protein DinB
MDKTPQGNLPEVWLRGPVEGVPALLQPVAHALLQAQEEIHETLAGLTPDQLWKRPGGVASAAFHVQHIAGVLQRLFTYSKGEALTAEQLKYLSSEGIEDARISKELLLNALDEQISKSVDYLKTVDPQTLTQSRTVGRKQLPSTVMGLLFHSAEHTMRHTGQLIVTVRALLK